MNRRGSINTDGCIFEIRPEDTIFTWDVNGDLHINMKDYVVIPKEKYNKIIDGKPIIKPQKSWLQKFIRNEY
jgi:hypothetical protein